MTGKTERLLAAAAEFIEENQGSPAFLVTFTERVTGDAELAGQLLDQAFAARTRAGNASLLVGAGDLRVGTTSAGACLSACALPARGGHLVIAARLVDARRQPIAGAALRWTAAGEARISVTDQGGRANIRGPGPALLIEVGTGSETDAADGDPAGAGLIPLPRLPQRSDLELAAADGLDPGALAQAPWLMQAGGVEFLGHSRIGGCDLTLVVTGVDAAVADVSTGTRGVAFLTVDAAGGRQRWIVPLAATPRGLTGALYGITDGFIDPGSVTLHGMEELLSALAGQAEEVIGRSVQHADADTAWRALSGRLASGALRALVDGALAARDARP